MAGMLPEKKFFLFGRPIGHSLSPAIHNAAFGALGLPFTYERHETDSIEEVIKVVKLTGFGGASVTMPLKEAAVGVVDHVTRAARAIGAVNTISRLEGELYGDNTDWLAIYSLVRKIINDYCEEWILYGFMTDLDVFMTF